MLRTKRIGKCRLCKSKKLKDLFSLGNLCVNDFVKDTKKKPRRAPLTMVQCDECKLLQLQHTEP